MNEDFKKLKEIRAKLNEITVKYAKAKGYKISKADDGEDSVELESKIEDNCADIEYLFYILKYTNESIRQIENSLYNYAENHNKGHLPPISGAEKMEKALKALGIDKDYEIYKPAVWVSATDKHTLEFGV